MQIYLPIAEISVNAFLILAMGGGVGVLSGLFGVGGGFLMTPLLIFIGIPPAVAVATEANQIVASSVSGVLAHWRRGNVDVRMGMVLLAGGIVGSTLGVGLFTWLRELGQVDLVIRLSYVVFLGIIGWLMLIESLRAIFRRRTSGRAPAKEGGHHNWMHGLPLKMRFRKSRLYISSLLPFTIGLVVGVLAAIMGVGGGFIMVPAMIYLLGMPTSVVVGTSLLQIIFVTANVTMLQSVTNQTVDVMLALLLLVGGVIGAQIGARFGTRLHGEQLRGLLAVMVIIVCLKLTFDLVIEPADLYSYAVGLTGAAEGH
ncbi:MAG: sulfite exporter TauE/SafE family protein [Rhodospirillales bacterium]